MPHHLPNPATWPCFALMPTTEHNRQVGTLDIFAQHSIFLARPTAFTTNTLLSDNTDPAHNGIVASDSSEPMHKPVRPQLSHRTSVHHVKLDDNVIIDVHENQVSRRSLNSAFA